MDVSRRWSTQIGAEKNEKAAEQVELAPGLIVKVASLAGLAILKLIAWSDRDSATPKDTHDLYQLMTQYADGGNIDRLYEAEFATLEVAEYDPEIAGAIISICVTETAQNPFMNQLNSPTPKFAFIDWMRGIAAMLVIYFHFDLHIIHRYPDLPIPKGTFTDYFVLGSYFDLGKYGVALFFLVSGFLIPATLAAPGATLRSYTIHRFFRLYPGYWVSLLAFVVVQFVFNGGMSVEWRDVAINATMLHKFVGIPDVVGTYWTLQIELIFYALCALLFIAGRLHRRIAVVVTALIGGLVCAFIRYRTATPLPIALFIGLALMFVGDGLRGLAERRASIKQVAVLAGAVAIGLIPIALLAYKHDGIRYVVTYWAALGTFMTAFAVRERIEQAVHANRIGRLLADYSYGAYLLHGSVGAALGGVAYAATGSAGWAALAMFGSTYLLAYAVFHCIEQPCIQIGRSIALRRQTQTAVQM